MDNNEATDQVIKMNDMIRKLSVSMEEAAKNIISFSLAYSIGSEKRLESGLWAVQYNHQENHSSTYTTSSATPTAFNMEALKEIMGALEQVKPTPKLIASNYAYKTKTVVYGIADKRRPNNKKMLYRKKTIKVPMIYRFNNMIVYHTSLESKIRNIIEGQGR